MSQDNHGFVIGSKEELEEQGSSNFSALAPESYVVYLAVIDFTKAPNWTKARTMDWSNPTCKYKTICLPVGLRAGGTMRDVEGNEVKPYGKVVFRDINPFAVGFQPDKVSPSHLRGLVQTLENAPMSGQIKPKKVLIIDPDKNEVTNSDLRDKVLAEATGKVSDKPLTQQGYKVLVDIRDYQGRYIAVDMETKETKGGKLINVITKFKPVPESFVTPSIDDHTAEMENFMKFYDEHDKKEKENLAKNLGKPTPQGTPVQNSTSDELGEVEIEDVAL